MEPEERAELVPVSWVTEFSPSLMCGPAPRSLNDVQWLTTHKHVGVFVSLKTGHLSYTHHLSVCDAVLISVPFDIERHGTSNTPAAVVDLPEPGPPNKFITIMRVPSRIVYIAILRMPSTSGRRHTGGSS